MSQGDDSPLSPCNHERLSKVSSKGSEFRLQVTASKLTQHKPKFASQKEENEYFGRLISGQEIGKGAYGVVKTALDPETGKILAIKTMHIDESNKNTLHASFCKTLAF